MTTENTPVVGDTVLIKSFSTYPSAQWPMLEMQYSGTMGRIASIAHPAGLVIYEVATKQGRKLNLCVGDFELVSLDDAAYDGPILAGDWVRLKPDFGKGVAHITPTAELARFRSLYGDTLGQVVEIDHTDLQGFVVKMPDAVKLCLSRDDFQCIGANFRPEKTTLIDPAKPDTAITTVIHVTQPPASIPTQDQINARCDQLEQRYIVLKCRDVLKALTTEEQEILQVLTDKIDKYRFIQRESKPPLEGVFIETDWPEFMPVTDMLLERIEREEQAKQEGFAKALGEWEGVQKDV